MADDDATMLQRQSAGDLLRRMSHRKAFADAFPQVRLARQLEAAIHTSPALGQLLGPDRVVAPLPDSGASGVALHLPTDWRGRPDKGRRNMVLSSTGWTHAADQHS